MAEEESYEAAKARVVAMAQLFMQQQAVTEAELAAHGIFPVSIAHGDPETKDEADLVFEVVPALARVSGLLISTRAGNDFHTFLFAGRGAEQAATVSWRAC